MGGGGGRESFGVSLDLKIYKPGQGATARWASYGLLVSLLFYGMSSFHGFLLGIPGPDAVDSFLTRDLLGGPLPVVGWQITGAFLGSTVLFVAALFGIHFLLNRPQTVDLLIDTEIELRKVTWSTLPDGISSSLVVIGTVVAFGVFLAGADFFFNLLIMEGLFGVR